MARPTSDITPREHAEPTMGTAFQNQLSSMNAVLMLSIMLAQSTSAEQVVSLATGAVASVVSGCRSVGLFHPSDEGTYFESADGELAAQLTAVWPAGGALHLTGSAWAWAYPLTVGRDEQPLLVVVGESEPSEEERFLVSVLAQMCGTAVQNVELLRAERSSAAKLAALNARLEETVAALEMSMAVHERLNEVAASQGGEAGIARVLHHLIGLPVRIEDRHGNVRAKAGEQAGEPGGKQSPSVRHALIQKLRHERRPVHAHKAWWSVAEPRAGVIGVIAVLDAHRKPGKQELYALEYATTVLSMELARLQSAADADLRMRRDIAEELLTGIDEETARTRAHALGYDLLRPHRVIIASPISQRTVNDAFFQVVSRHVRDLDIGSLLVGRSDSVIVLAYNDVDWRYFKAQIDHELAATSCRLAVGSRFDAPAQIAQSYQEARFVMELAASARGPLTSAVLLFEDLGVYRLLSSVSDTSQMERFMYQFLAELLAYDQQHRAELVHTLARYFECGGRLDDTAKALHVHRSTLKYRLQRIREISGHDLSDGSTRFNLELATKMWQTLRTLSPGSPVPAARPAPPARPSPVPRPAGVSLAAPPDPARRA